MLNLYAVLLGGRAEKCNIELHDVVFIVGRSLEAVYPQLVPKWFGLRKRLHIDASIKLQYVDGYEISVRSQKPENNALGLYFINFGGYKEGYFGEMHEINFYIATSKEEALARAKQTLCAGMSQQHCDDNHLIDDIIRIETVDTYYLHFTPSTQQIPLTIEAHYRRLDVPEIMKAVTSQ
jgi:hypothetical protein